MTDGQDLDPLEEQLARVLAQVDPMPGGVAEAAHAAYLVRNLDQELAELIFDSMTEPEPVLVRGESAERHVSFATSNLTIEITVSGEPRRIVGQLVPPQAAELDLTKDAVVIDTATADDLGRFQFDDVPSGAISIECRPGEGSDWRVRTVELDI